jgi:hypothetical protein
MPAAGPVKAYVLDVLDFTDWAGQYLEALQSYHYLLVGSGTSCPLSCSTLCPWLGSMLNLRCFGWEAGAIVTG